MTTAAIHWTVKQPMPKPEAGAAAALLGGELVFAGGTRWENDVKLWMKEVQVYDLAKDHWRMGPELPEALAYGPFAQSETSFEIYGGTGNGALSRKIWRLGASKSRWTQAGEAPADLLLGRAVRIGNRVFLFGGCKDVVDMTTCTDAVWSREGEGPWSVVSKLPTGRLAMPALVVSGGKIYMFGGCSMNEPAKLVNRAESYVFDPAMNHWKRLRDLPAPNRGATTVVSGRGIYIFGGFTEGFTADVLRYDIAGDAYQKASPLPAPLCCAEVFLHHGTVYGAGGEDKAKSRSGRTLAGVIE